MLEGPQAVFLSYASQDVEAAKRIHDALQAAGVEVWMDQEGGLVGGDAWDRKIRGQIATCGLFIPLISAHTQARLEGYFRLEWHLAEQRSLLMAKGRPFIVPVSVDATTERGAQVPDAFLAVQWTKLPGGETSATFVTRVQAILSGPGVPAPTTSTVMPPENAVTTPRRIRPQVWGFAALGAVMLLLAAFMATRPGSKEPAAPSPRTAEANPPPSSGAGSATAALASTKSIAVLPFANMSDDQDKTAFFSDGIHEDILTSLSNIRELRVVSRTTVMGYRATTKKMAEIARELGVTYVLEGSVRRSGNRVRVTGQLIRAATDEHLWAQNYDRDLTDIFAIQSELSQAIAGELKAVLSPDEKRLLAQSPTQNLAAYELVLKARQLRNRNFPTPELIRQREQLLLSAVQLDPGYAAAHAELAYFYIMDGNFIAGGSEVNKARAALERAIQLGPNLPDVVRAQADYYYYGENDFPRALEHYARFAALRPNDPAYFNRVGAIQRRQGHFAESLATWRQLEQLDPANTRNLRDLAVLLAAGRRFDEAIVQARRVLEREHENLPSRYELAFLSFAAKESMREAEAFFAGLSAEARNSPPGRKLRQHWALRTGDLDEAIRLQSEATPDPNILDNGDFTELVAIAVAFLVKGDGAAAQALLLRPVAEIKARNASVLASAFIKEFSKAYLSAAEVVLGHPESALRLAREALEEEGGRDHLTRGNLLANLAFVQTWAGDKEAALATLARCLRTPYGYLAHPSGRYNDVTVHTLRRDPRFGPLRGDPRFEALLNDPQNHAPLF